MNDSLKCDICGRECEDIGYDDTGSEIICVECLDDMRYDTADMAMDLQSEE